jgi:hypothetical protein
MRVPIDFGVEELDFPVFFFGEDVLSRLERDILPIPRGDATAFHVRAGFTCGRRDKGADQLTLLDAYG